MAKFEILIPFILYCEAGLTAKDTALPYDQMFEKARPRGFADDPADSGGPTLCGVTLDTYRAYRTANLHATTTVDDLKRISYDEWRQILKLLFWNKYRADEIQCQAVANALVDWAWASGKYGITYPQKILGVKADGIVGPKTLAAINSYPDQQELFQRIQQARLSYHERIVRRNPMKKRFLRGWQRRVNLITWNGFNYE